MVLNFAPIIIEVKIIKKIGNRQVKIKKTIFSLNLIFLNLSFSTKKKTIIKKGVKIINCFNIKKEGKSK